MPKIYEYFGIIFLFYTNEHDPIHVHAKYGNSQTKFELVIRNGRVIDIIRKRLYKNELPEAQLRQAEEFINAKKEKIMEKWIEVLVKKQKVKMQRVTRKV